VATSDQNNMLRAWEDTFVAYGANVCNTTQVDAHGFAQGMFSADGLNWSITAPPGPVGQVTSCQFKDVSNFGSTGPASGDDHALVQVVGQDNFY
jgi:hypothetical protein